MSKTAEEVLNRMDQILAGLTEQKAQFDKIEADADAWVKSIGHGIVEELGSFEVTSGKVVVTDPCYERGTWCAGVLDGVRNGRWLGYAFIAPSDFGICVHELTIHHADLGDEEVELQLADFEVGVDSGKAGIFDEAMYPSGKKLETWDSKSSKRIETDCPFDYRNEAGFYKRACNASRGGERSTSKWIPPTMVGVMPEGVVSSSGIGDGSYECQYHRNADGEIDYITIIFIDEDEDEED